MVRDGIGHVEVVGKALYRLPPITEGPHPGPLKHRVTLSRIEEVAAAVQQAPVTLETPLHRMLVLAAAKMPFAAERAAIARLAQDLADGHHVAVEPGAKARMQTGKNRGPGRIALGTVVELGKAKPLLRHSIYIGRTDLAPVTTDVGIAHVVAENENDIRSLGEPGRAQK